MSPERREQAATLYELAMKVAFPLLLGCAGWAFNTLWDHGNRLTAIESSRYTRDQADEDMGELSETLSQIRVALAADHGTQKSNEQRLTRIEERLGQLVDVIHAIETKVMHQPDRR